jgi:hypothetical protein
LHINVPYRIALLVLLLISVPYLTAWAASGPGHSFGGFLLNPADGNSYLAKMYEGWRGDWRFTLPYTADPDQGAYLFTFYLLLGHLARLLRLPLIGVFHLARLIGAVLLLWALWRFLQNLDPQGKHTRLVFALACLGLGMGWLAFPFGVVTSDFWVAEAYPFLSAYTNPHFVLSLAILVWLLTIRPPASDNPQHQHLRVWGGAAFALLASAVLGSLSPFAVVLGLAILGIVLVLKVLNGWLSIRSSSTGFSGLVSDLRADWSFRLTLLRLVCIFLGGAPVVLYAVWIVRFNPVLAAWNAQNLTPAPPLWDLLLAFSPALLLALLGLRQVWRRKEIQIQIVGVWAVLALVMVYLPFGLQRRFLVGLAVPLAALAGFGLEWLESRIGPRVRSTAIAALVLTFPTLLLVILAGQFGALAHDPLLYLTRGEAQALSWVESNTPAHALLLAAPQTGMFIPAHTGRRVLYGHPFETVDADVEETAVTSFFTNAAANPLPAADFLEKRKVDYVFYGPREQLLGQLPDLPGLSEVYSQAGVTIYRVAGP